MAGSGLLWASQLGDMQSDLRRAGPPGPENLEQGNAPGFANATSDSSADDHGRVVVACRLWHFAHGFCNGVGVGGSEGAPGSDGGSGRYVHVHA